MNCFVLVIKLFESISVIRSIIIDVFP